MADLVQKHPPELCGIAQLIYPYTDHAVARRPDLPGVAGAMLQPETPPVRELRNGRFHGRSDAEHADRQAECSEPPHAAIVARRASASRQGNRARFADRTLTVIPF
jgi:hypothetical protein